MDIQEAKKIIEKGIKPEYKRLRQYDGYKYTGGWLEAIETVLSELDKIDKIIYNLAFALADYVMYYEYDKCRNPEMIKNKAKEQIEYFTNKVEEDK